MAKRRETVGTGITAREMTYYSGEDMGPFVKAFARRWNAALSEGGGRFGAVVLDAERTYRRILAGAGAGPFEEDSVEDYATRILRMIELTRGEIARGDADGAARLAVGVGRLCTEHYMKELWEAHALRGAKNDSILKANSGSGNQKRQGDAKRRYATWQSIADEHWKLNPHLSKSDVADLIAKKVECNSGTIRRKIMRK